MSSIISAKFFLLCKINDDLRHLFFNDLKTHKDISANKLKYIINPSTSQQVMKSLGSFIKQSVELRTVGTLGHLLCYVLCVMCYVFFFYFFFIFM